MVSPYRFARSIIAAAVGTALGVVVSPGPAQAMPQFARQAGVECSVCHTTIPRLTREGYEFRRAGFRFADEIGTIREWEGHRTDAKYNVANDFSARLQMNGSYQHRDHATDDGSYTANSESFDNAQAEFKEFTLYPVTGGFLKNWASMSEISGGTDEIEVENAYVRYVTGQDGKFYELRVGVFHPFEGFGASDRPLGLSRPYIQSKPTTNGFGDKNGFHPWGFDQAGVEAGLQYNNTSLSVTMFNGLIENADDPAQGGKLKKGLGTPTKNNKDIQVFANQFIGSTDAAIGAYYYRGYLSIGDDPDFYQDTFNRYALYLTLPLPVVDVLAGYGGGTDDASGVGSVSSNGGFVEVDRTLNGYIGSGVRLDVFDPSDAGGDNTMYGVSAFANAPLDNGLQLITEYRYATSQHGAGPDQTENSVNVRAIYIW